MAKAKKVCLDFNRDNIKAFERLMAKVYIKAIIKDNTISYKDIVLSYLDSVERSIIKALDKNSDIYKLNSELNENLAKLEIAKSNNDNKSIKSLESTIKKNQKDLEKAKKSDSGFTDQLNTHKMLTTIYPFVIGLANKNKTIIDHSAANNIPNIGIQWAIKNITPDMLDSVYSYATTIYYGKMNDFTSKDLKAYNDFLVNKANIAYSKTDVNPANIDVVKTIRETLNTLIPDLISGIKAIIKEEVTTAVNNAIDAVKSVYENKIDALNLTIDELKSALEEANLGQVGIEPNSVRYDLNKSTIGLNDLIDGELLVIKTTKSINSTVDNEKFDRVEFIYATTINGELVTKEASVKLNDSDYNTALKEGFILMKQNKDAIVKLKTDSDSFIAKAAMNNKLVIHSHSVIQELIPEGVNKDEYLTTQRQFKSLLTNSLFKARNNDITDYKTLLNARKNSTKDPIHNGTALTINMAHKAYIDAKGLNDNTYKGTFKLIWSPNITELNTFIEEDGSFDTNRYTLVYEVNGERMQIGIVRRDGKRKNTNVDNGKLTYVDNDLQKELIIRKGNENVIDLGTVDIIVDTLRPGRYIKSKQTDTPISVDEAIAKIKANGTNVYEKPYVLTVSKDNDVRLSDNYSINKGDYDSGMNGISGKTIMFTSSTLSPNEIKKHVEALMNIQSDTDKGYLANQLALTLLKDLNISFFVLHSKPIKFSDFLTIKGDHIDVLLDSDPSIVDSLIDVNNKVTPSESGFKFTLRDDLDDDAKKERNERFKVLVKTLLTTFQTESKSPSNYGIVSKLLDIAKSKDNTGTAMFNVINGEPKLNLKYFQDLKELDPNKGKVFIDDNGNSTKHYTLFEYMLKDLHIKHTSKHFTKTTSKTVKDKQLEVYKSISELPYWSDIMMYFYITNNASKWDEHKTVVEYNPDVKGNRLPFISEYNDDIDQYIGNWKERFSIAYTGSLSPSYSINIGESLFGKQANQTALIHQNLKAKDDLKNQYPSYDNVIEVLFSAKSDANKFSKSLNSYLTPINSTDINDYVDLRSIATELANMGNLNIDSVVNNVIDAHINRLMAKQQKATNQLEVFNNILLPTADGNPIERFDKLKLQWDNSLDINAKTALLNQFFGIPKNKWDEGYRYVKSQFGDSLNLINDITNSHSLDLWFHSDNSIKEYKSTVKDKLLNALFKEIATKAKALESSISYKTTDKALYDTLLDIFKNNNLSNYASSNNTNVQDFINVLIKHYKLNDAQLGIKLPIDIGFHKSLSSKVTNPSNNTVTDYTKVYNEKPVNTTIVEGNTVPVPNMISEVMNELLGSVNVEGADIDLANSIIEYKMIPPKPLGRNRMSQLAEDVSSNETITELEAIALYESLFGKSFTVSFSKEHTLQLLKEAYQSGKLTTDQYNQAVNEAQSNEASDYRKVLGYTLLGIIQLNSFDGKVYTETVMHEALHRVMDILPIDEKKKIFNDAREHFNTPNATDKEINERLAELYGKTYKDYDSLASKILSKLPKSIRDLFDWIRSIWYKVNNQPLYSKLFKDINAGMYQGFDTVVSDDVQINYQLNKDLSHQYNQLAEALFSYTKIINNKHIKAVKYDMFDSMKGLVERNVYNRLYVLNENPRVNLQDVKIELTTYFKDLTYLMDTYGDENAIKQLRDSNGDIERLDYLTYLLGVPVTLYTNKKNIDGEFIKVDVYPIDVILDYLYPISNEADGTTDDDGNTSNDTYQRVTHFMEENKKIEMDSDLRMHIRNTPIYVWDDTKNKYVIKKRDGKVAEYVDERKGVQILQKAFVQAKLTSEFVEPTYNEISDALIGLGTNESISLAMRFFYIGPLSIEPSIRFVVNNRIDNALAKSIAKDKGVNNLIDLAQIIPNYEAYLDDYKLILSRMYNFGTIEQVDYLDYKNGKPSIVGAKSSVEDAKTRKGMTKAAIHQKVLKLDKNTGLYSIDTKAIKDIVNSLDKKEKDKPSVISIINSLIKDNLLVDKSNDYMLSYSPASNLSNSDTNRLKEDLNKALIPIYKAFGIHIPAEIAKMYINERSNINEARAYIEAGVGFLTFIADIVDNTQTLEDVNKEGIKELIKLLPTYRPSYIQNIAPDLGLEGELLTYSATTYWSSLGVVINAITSLKDAEASKKLYVEDGNGNKKWVLTNVRSYDRLLKAMEVIKSQYQDIDQDIPYEITRYVESIESLRNGFRVHPYLTNNDWKIDYKGQVYMNRLEGSDKNKSKKMTDASPSELIKMSYNLFYQPGDNLYIMGAPVADKPTQPYHIFNKKNAVVTVKEGKLNGHDINKLPSNSTAYTMSRNILNGYTSYFVNDVLGQLNSIGNRLPDSNVKSLIRTYLTTPVMGAINELKIIENELIALKSSAKNYEQKVALQNKYRETALTKAKAIDSSMKDLMKAATDKGLIEAVEYEINKSVLRVGGKTEGAAYLKKGEFGLSKEMLLHMELQPEEYLANLMNSLDKEARYLNDTMGVTKLGEDNVIENDVVNDKVMSWLLTSALHNALNEEYINGIPILYKDLVDLVKRSINVNTGYDTFDTNHPEGLDKEMNVIVRPDRDVNEFASDHQAYEIMEYMGIQDKSQAVLDGGGWVSPLMIIQQAKSTGGKHTTWETLKHILGERGYVQKYALNIITNELLANGDKRIWNELLTLLGGHYSPIYRKWIQIRSEMSKGEIEDNRDWYALSDWYVKERNKEFNNPNQLRNYLLSTELYKESELDKAVEVLYKTRTNKQTGELIPNHTIAGILNHIVVYESAIKIAPYGISKESDEAPTITSHNTNMMGVVTSLYQDLHNSTIALINQENYIFSTFQDNHKEAREIYMALGSMADDNLKKLERRIYNKHKRQLMEDYKADNPYNEGMDKKAYFKSMSHYIENAIKSGNYKPDIDYFYRELEGILTASNVTSNTLDAAMQKINANMPLLKGSLSGAISSVLKKHANKFRLPGARFTVVSSTGIVKVYDVTISSDKGIDTKTFTLKSIVNQGYGSVKVNAYKYVEEPTTGKGKKKIIKYVKEEKLFDTIQDAINEGYIVTDPNVIVSSSDSITIKQRELEYVRVARTDGTVIRGTELKNYIYAIRDEEFNVPMRISLSDIQGIASLEEALAEYIPNAVDGVINITSSEYIKAVTDVYMLLPQEVMMSRDGIAEEFDIPKHLDVSDVNAEFFAKEYLEGTVNDRFINNIAGSFINTLNRIIPSTTAESDEGREFNELAIDRLIQSKINIINNQLKELEADDSKVDTGIYENSEAMNKALTNNLSLLASAVFQDSSTKLALVIALDNKFQSNLTHYTEKYNMFKDETNYFKADTLSIAKELVKVALVDGYRLKNVPVVLPKDYNVFNGTEDQFKELLGLKLPTEEEAIRYGVKKASEFSKSLVHKQTRIPVTGFESVAGAVVVGFIDSNANTVFKSSLGQKFAGEDNDGDMISAEWKSAKKAYSKLKANLFDTKMKVLFKATNIRGMMTPIDGFVPFFNRMEEGESYKYKRGSVISNSIILSNNQIGKTAIGPFVKLGEVYSNLYQLYELKPELGNFPKPFVFNGRRYSDVGGVTIPLKKIVDGQERMVETKYKGHTIVSYPIQKFTSSIIEQANRYRRLIGLEPLTYEEQLTAEIVFNNGPIDGIPNNDKLHGELYDKYRSEGLITPEGFTLINNKLQVMDFMAITKLVSYIVNASLDNAKNALLYKVNINNTTMSIIEGMIYSQMDINDILTLSTDPIFKMIVNYIDNKNDLFEDSTIKLTIQGVVKDLLFNKAGKPSNLPSIVGNPKDQFTRYWFNNNKNISAYKVDDEIYGVNELRTYTIDRFNLVNEYKRVKRSLSASISTLDKYKTKDPEYVNVELSKAIDEKTNRLSELSKEIKTLTDKIIAIKYKIETVKEARKLAESKFKKLKGKRLSAFENKLAQASEDVRLLTDQFYNEATSYLNKENKNNELVAISQGKELPMETTTDMDNKDEATAELERLVTINSVMEDYSYTPEEIRLFAKNNPKLMNITSLIEDPNNKSVVEPYANHILLVLAAIYKFNKIGEEVNNTRSLLSFTQRWKSDNASFLSSMEKLINILGFNSIYNKKGLKAAISAIEMTLLNYEGDEWSTINAVTDYNKSVDAINPRVVLMGNSFVKNAVRGFIKDFKLKQEYLIDFNDIILGSTLKITKNLNSLKYSERNRTMYHKELNKAVLARMYFETNPFLPESITTAYPQFKNIHLGTPEGRRSFMSEVYKWFIANEVELNLHPYINNNIDKTTVQGTNYGILEFINAHNLDPNYKRKALNSFSLLPQNIQQILFYYSLIKDNMDLGRGSLAESIPVELMEEYSNWITDFQNELNRVDVIKINDLQKQLEDEKDKIQILQTKYLNYVASLIIEEKNNINEESVMLLVENTKADGSINDKDLTDNIHPIPLVDQLKSQGLEVLPNDLINELEMKISSQFMDSDMYKAIVNKITSLDSQITMLTADSKLYKRIKSFIPSIMLHNPQLTTKWIAYDSDYKIGTKEKAIGLRNRIMSKEGKELIEANEDFKKLMNSSPYLYAPLVISVAEATDATGKEANPLKYLAKHLSKVMRADDSTGYVHLTMKEGNNWHKVLYKVALWRDYSYDDTIKTNVPKHCTFTLVRVFDKYAGHSVGNMYGNFNNTHSFIPPIDVEMQKVYAELLKVELANSQTTIDSNSKNVRPFTLPITDIRKPLNTFYSLDQIYIDYIMNLNTYDSEINKGSEEIDTNDLTDCK